MTRMLTLPAGYLMCEDCAGVVQRNGPTQRYCEPCSTARHVERQRKWAGDHPQTPEQRARTRTPRVAALRERGLAASVGEDIAWPSDGPPALAWLVRVAVPFDYAASKNAIHRFSVKGHVYLREETNEYRGALTEAVRSALAGRHVATNRLWLDILVEKPNHKGDAVNVVDLVADAVKDATKVDDRWYSIRRLDWRIVKTGGRLIVGIGQESEDDAQVCSYCGAVLPLTAFVMNRSARNGRGRVCESCRRPVESAALPASATPRPPVLQLRRGRGR